MTYRRLLVSATVSCSLMIASSPILADNENGNFKKECRELPTHAELRVALKNATDTSSGGLGLNMWGTVVNRDGIVCAVAFTGNDRGDQWPGSRVISALKAYTGNAFSLDGVAISTATLYGLVQPGGSLYGLSDSNPVDTKSAYKGPAKRFGKANDPMVGKRVGGINTFGGGLPLYNNGVIVGGVGVSGDTSCEDHEVADQLRTNLGLDAFTGGADLDGIPDSHPSCD